MPLADAARAASRTIQQMLVERELAKRQAMLDEIARMRESRADRELALRESDSKFDRERLGRLDTRQAGIDAQMETDRVAGRARELGDQIPADVRLSADDPAVATLQRGGLDSLLTGVDPTLGSRQMQGYATLPGSNVAGEVTQQESKPKPTGFIKTRSQNQAATAADDERQSAQDRATAERNERLDAETRRSNAADEAIARGHLGVAQGGLKVRQAEAAATNPALGPQNEVQDALDLIDSISTDESFSSAVGPLDAYIGKARDLTGVTRFDNRHKELLGKLSLAQAGKLKGQGAISNYERELLQNAASALTRNLSEADYKAELAKIRSQFVRMQQQSSMFKGATPPVDVRTVPMVSPDGRNLMVPAEKVAEMESLGAKRR